MIDQPLAAIQLSIPLLDGLNEVVVWLRGLFEEITGAREGLGEAEGFVLFCLHLLVHFFVCSFQFGDAAGELEELAGLACW